ncbi:MAG: site-specific DNA-methyltransferase [Clostridia bacterium]|nr:site-specific DNA-methyltransferase [Clostridia bacterium]
MEACFYYKDPSRKIVPVPDDVMQIRAKEKLDQILQSNKYEIPSLYKENWDEVKLYHPAGNIEKAISLMLKVEDGAYDLRNRINNMTGKEWTKFTCSWFIFNALRSDLAEEKAVTTDTALHPATFSPTMVSEFIRFFTKEGDTVLDPFAGIGSTLVACERTGRIGYGIELSSKYFSVINKRVPKLKNNIYNTDCRNIDKLNLPKINYSISSPPYWDVLNRSTDGFKADREERGLDYNYSDEFLDLGNISDYETFLNEVCSVYLKMYDILADGAYITIIVKNVKKGGKMYPLAWDIARILSEKYVLKDEKIWIQDKIALSPYGYPHSWASNILHHYCLILRKE